MPQVTSDKLINSPSRLPLYSFVKSKEWGPSVHSFINFIQCIIWTGCIDLFDLFVYICCFSDWPFQKSKYCYSHSCLWLLLLWLEDKGFLILKVPTMMVQTRKGRIVRGIDYGEKSSCHPLKNGYAYILFSCPNFIFSPYTLPFAFSQW